MYCKRKIASKISNSTSLWGELKHKCITSIMTHRPVLSNGCVNHLSHTLNHTRCCCCCCCSMELDTERVKKGEDAKMAQSQHWVWWREREEPTEKYKQRGAEDGIQCVRCFSREDVLIAGVSFFFNLLLSLSYSLTLTDHLFRAKCPWSHLLSAPGLNANCTFAGVSKGFLGNPCQREREKRVNWGHTDSVWTWGRQESGEPER